MADNMIPMVRDGKVRLIAPDEIEGALKMGATIQGSDADGMVPMVREGKTRLIPQPEVHKALGMGATIAEQPDEIEAEASPDGSISEPILEAPSAPAKPDDGQGGLTFMQGLSRYAGGDLVREGLNKLETAAQNKMIEHGLVTPDVARDYDVFQGKEQVAQNQVNHPTAAALGEGAGILAQTLAPVATGAGLLSKASTAVAAKVAAKAVPSAFGAIGRGAAKFLTQGAIEGGAYGAAKEVDDAFLHDDYEGVAEKALAGAREGAKIGAGMSLAVGGGASALGAGLKKLSGAWVGAMEKAADSESGAGWAKRIARSIMTTEEGAKQVIGKYKKQTNDIIESLKATLGASKSATDDAISGIRTDLESATKAANAEHAITSKGRAADLDRTIRDLDDEFDGLVSKQKQAYEDVTQKRHLESVGKFNEWLAGASKAREELDLTAKRAWYGKEATADAPVEPGDVRTMFGLAKDDLEQLAEDAAVKYDNAGGLSVVKTLVKKWDDYETELFGKASNAKLTEGDAHGVLDQMKRDLQKVVDQSTDRRPYLAAALKPKADRLTAFLENRARELQPWSPHVADMQMRSNRSWARSIASQNDSDLGKALGEIGAHDPNNAFRQPQKVRDAFMASAFSNAGKAQSAQERLALRNWLESTSADVALRGRMYGSPEIVETASMMEKNARALISSIDDAANIDAAHEAALNALNTERRNATDLLRKQHQDAVEHFDRMHGNRVESLKKSAQESVSSEEAKLEAAKQANIESVKQAEDQFEKAAATVDKNRDGSSIGSFITGAAFGTGGPVGAMGAWAAQRALKSIGTRVTEHLYPSAVSTQQTINQASKLPGIIGNAVEKAGEVARPLKEMFDINKALNHLRMEADPTTAQGEEHNQTLAQIADEAGPEMAQAIKAKYDAKAQFLLDKAGPQPVDMFGRPAPYPPAIQDKLRRYMDAADDPQGALERIGNGKGTSEDRETLQAIYPKMWDEFAQKVLSNVDDKVPYNKRIKASFAIGLPLDSSLKPDNVAFYQTLARKPPQPAKSGGQAKPAGKAIISRGDSLGS